MPFITEFVESDRVMTYKGKEIFRAYNQDEYDDPCKFTFTSSPDSLCFDDDDFLFDIQDIIDGLKEIGKLPMSLRINIYREDRESPSFLNIIRLGIDHGLIKFPEK